MTRTSPTAVRALARFGLGADDIGGAPAPDLDVLDAVLAAHPGELTLLAGPSGSGKSTLLRAAIDWIRRDGSAVRVVDPDALRDDPRPAIDVVGGGLEAGMRAMVGAGLGEARLFARPACALSDGERWRLSVAARLRRARPGDWIVADEFASTLDRLTAISVSATVRRSASATGVRLLLAGAAEDLPGMLGPDLLVTTEPGAPPRLTRGVSCTHGPDVTIERGEIADLDRLSRWHYRGARPATWSMVLRAVVRRPDLDPVLAGVLVVSHPTLNAAWRDGPWPGRYAQRGGERVEKSRRARMLNRELRCISRVIVDPRCRGLGIAGRLVRAYLRASQTPGTESLSAMGPWTPFFERAGMRAYPMPPKPQDERLRDALDARGLASAELLCEEGARRAALDPLLRRELSRWASASRATRRWARAGITELVRQAGVRLSSTPTGYAHTA